MNTVKPPVEWEQTRSGRSEGNAPISRSRRNSRPESLGDSDNKHSTPSLFQPLPIADSLLRLDGISFRLVPAIGPFSLK
jgi:hypothetical protein